MRNDFTMVASFEEDGSIVEYPDVTIMQFTGLIDKDGKDIYEGDMIDMCGTGDKFQIVWKGIGFLFMNVDTNELYVFDTSVYQMEVIGNIHENPELLCQQ